MRGFVRPSARTPDGSIRLHDESRGQDRAAQARHPQGHLAVVLPRRQDRRARPERLRQVEPAADHGGRGQGIRRRGGADARTCASASCRRSRSSIPTQTVRETVEEGLARRARGEEEARGDLRGLRRARRRLRQARGRAGEVRGDHRGGGRRHRRADGDRRRRAAPAAVGREDRQALRRREAPRRAVPAAAVEARHAAARRADQPPRCRERRVARAVPAEVSRHRDRGHARPLLPRQRRRVDPRARPRLRHSVEGQLQLVARAEGSAARDRGEAGGRAHQGDAEGARVGARRTRRAGRRRARRASRASRSCRRTSTRSATRRRRSSSRSPSGSATR